ncbi:MAG TPA: methyl-accepting chemotaxis protein [Bacilli bacterium]|nr:methyl-accepting chemotaxis protein [Bacilli bacterium]
MNMNVKMKLQMGFGIILLFLIIISGIGMYNLQENGQTLAKIEKEQQVAALYQDIAFQTVRANAAIRGYMLYYNEEMKTNHYDIRNQLHQAIEQLEALGEDSEDFQQFLVDLNQWETSIDNEIMPLLMSGQKEEAQTIAGPVLGKGSQNLVVFGKTMANQVTEEIANNILTIKDRENNRLVQMIILVIVAVITSFTISTIFGRRIAKTINELVIKMNEFSNGNFATNIQVKTKDEFGSLAQSFNEMTENLRHTMKMVGDSSEQVAATAEQLTASSNEVSLSTEVVTESIQDISQGVEVQNRLTTEVNTLSMNVLQKMNDINSNIVIVNESAQTTKSLANQGQHSVDDVMAQMDMISDKTDALTEQMKELDASTNAIVEAVNMIKDIATQTNLLAINASIEAARSGEHGKGFAVVATEVRKLADESNLAAIEIEKMATTIANHTDRIVEEIIDNDQAVSLGKEKVDIASQSFTNIDQSVEDVQAQTEAVTAAIRQIYADIEKLVQDIDHIHEVSMQTNDNVQSVAASSEEQNASMEEVAAASTHLSTMAIELQEAIQKFKF